MERNDRSVLFRMVRLALKSERADAELLILLDQMPSDSDKARGLRAKIRDRLNSGG